MSPLIIILAIFFYSALLFSVAYAVEKQSPFFLKISRSPVVYSLSLAVYCTSWTYYGSVGSAANSGLSFLGVYLGPTMMIFLWWVVLRRMVLIKDNYRITSIADFISARYSKSQTLAALVTLMALIGNMPYIALQFAAIKSTLTLLIPPETTGSFWLIGHFGPLSVVLMTFFTVMFGARKLDPTERHRGMMTAISLESIIKLLAFSACGIFATYSLIHGRPEGFLSSLLTNPDTANVFRISDGENGYATWTTILLLSMSAILFLPRQFHVAVVENSSTKNILSAMWQFPLYMLLINIFVLPIALYGIISGIPLSSADTYVLNIPVSHGRHWLALFVFIGGFSAATSMIMIAAMTMSTMLVNHLLLPLFNVFRPLAAMRRNLLGCRWLSILCILSIGYWFQTKLGESYALVNMGLISFAAVIQFAPAALGALFWSYGSKLGAISGLAAGFSIWLYTLLIPAFIKSGLFSTALLDNGPWGLHFLRPEHLFGLNALPPLPHTVFWSLFFNIGAFILVSHVFGQSEEEHAIALDFKHITQKKTAFSTESQEDDLIDIERKITIIHSILNDYFSPQKSEEIVAQKLADMSLLGRTRIPILDFAELLRSIEIILAGSIGAAMAHRALNRVHILTQNEKTRLSKAYAEILSGLNLSPRELAEKIYFYREREQLLTTHGKELEQRIRENEQEIEARIQVEKTLKATEQQYHSIFDNALEGIFQASAEGRILAANPAMASIMGYPSSAVMMREVPDIRLHFSEISQRDSFFRRLTAGKNVENFEIQAVDAGGKILWLNINARPSLDSQGKLDLIEGIVEDITEKKKVEVQLQQSQKMEALGTLTGGIAHDFNNILTAIIGYVNLLQMKIGNDAVLQSYANEILTSSKRAATLTKSLLAFSRKQEISTKPVNINDCIKNFEKFIARIIGEDIDLLITPSPEEMIVMADSSQLEQVLMNLATNARDAMKTGGMLSITTRPATLSPRDIRAHSSLKPGRHVEIAISDTGCGMDEATRLRIFEPFFTTKEVGKGTGLGLSILYGIVKQHNGEISVYSEVGKGTTFKIYLPTISSGIENLEMHKDLPPQGGSETILLIEDDSSLRKLERSILEQYGYTIIEAENGEEALEQFYENQEAIDCLLLDVIMPRKSGKEVYDEIRKSNPGIKTLFTSGYTADIIHKHGILEAHLHFLPKPATPSELLRKLREVLDQKD